MDIHERFDARSINKEGVGHGILLQFVLVVHFIDDFEYDLLHHEGGRTGQVYPMVEVFGLGLLRVPYFLGDRFAQASVDLYI